MEKYEIYLKLKVVLNVKVDGYIALGFYLLELAYSPSPSSLLSPHVLARINNNSRIKGRLLRRPSIPSKTHTVTLTLLIFLGMYK